MRRGVVLVACGVALAAHAAPPAATTPAARADAMFLAWDADHDGRLTAAEFRAGWVGLATRQAIEARLRTQFARLDANHDGALDAAEYAGVELARRAGAAAPLSRFDRDGDGRLRFGEYVGLVAALAPGAAPPRESERRP